MLVIILLLLLFILFSNKYKEPFFFNPFQGLTKQELIDGDASNFSRYYIQHWGTSCHPEKKECGDLRVDDSWGHSPWSRRGWVGSDSGVPSSMRGWMFKNWKRKGWEGHSHGEKRSFKHKFDDKN